MRLERGRLEAAIEEIQTVEPRTRIASAGGGALTQSILVDGFMSRHIDDERGLRRLVAVHVHGDFVDLHAFPLGMLDHDIATLTAATIVIVPLKTSHCDDGHSAQGGSRAPNLRSAG